MSWGSALNLYAKLSERKDRPLRVGLIGAGKFAAMYIAQVPRTPGVHLVGIADLAPEAACRNLERLEADARDKHAKVVAELGNGQRARIPGAPGLMPVVNPSMGFIEQIMLHVKAMHAGDRTTLPILLIGQPQPTTASILPSCT